MADAIDPNAGTGDTPANEEANLAKQELAEMKAKFEKLEKQSQGQSAMLRKVNESLEALQKPPVDEKIKGPMATKFAEMEVLKRDFAEEKAKAQEKLTRSRMTGLMRAVEGQLTNAGVKPSLAKLATEALTTRIKGSVTFEDSTGEDVALLKLGDELTSVASYVDSYLASDEGKELMPETEKPNLSGLMGKGSARTSGAKLRVTQSDLRSGRFKLEDVVAGRVVLTDG